MPARRTQSEAFRTVANNPAGEISLHLGITGPAYTIGAVCRR